MSKLDKDFLLSIKQAFKILGDGAEVPVPQGDITVQFDKAEKARGVVNKARDTLLEKMQEYEDALDSIKKDLVSYKRQIEKANFKLDEKKPEDKKKIAAARKVVGDACGNVLNGIIVARKPIDTLDKAAAANIE